MKLGFSPHPLASPLSSLGLPGPWALLTPQAPHSGRKAEKHRDSFWSRQGPPCPAHIAPVFLSRQTAPLVGKELTVVDLGHLVHHGDLEDKALGTGERQELGVRGGEPLPPSALEGHGAH